jgi:hypothetical protein
MASFEQANMLLSGARDANDRIRDANNTTTNTWNSQTKKIDEAEKEGKSWFHGISDVGVGGTALKSAYDTSQRMKALGGASYGDLAKIDATRFGNKLSSATDTAITSVKSGITTAGQKVGAIKTPTNLRDLTPEATGLQDVDIVKPTVAGGEATGGGFKGVQSTADLSAEDLKNAKVNFGDLQTSDVSTIADAGKDAESTALTLSDLKGGVGGVASKLAGVEASSLAGTALSKGIANVGGAVDLYKDFENIGKKGGFFGGTGATTMDEVGNIVTVGATALDVASVALPFLAPVAAATQLVGAGISTYDSIKDADKQEQDDKGDYQKNLINYEVPPSLAGTGFLASQQSDTHKLITGSSAF